MKNKFLIAVFLIMILACCGCSNEKNTSSDKSFTSEPITEISFAETTTQPNDCEIITVPITENQITESEAETTSATEIVSEESKGFDLPDTEVTTPIEEISQIEIAPEVSVFTETNTENEIATEPEDVPTPPEKDIEQTQPAEETAPSEPTVNIDFYVSYAEEFAENIGLQYDTSAIDCWDNPIAATSNSQRVLADI